MELLLEITSWCLILSGCFFLLIGAIGVLRMPEFYTRLHAAGLTDTLGAGFLLGGLLFQAGLNLTGLKLALIILFLLMTSPIATHALINAAYTARLAMGRVTDRTAEQDKGD